MTQRAARFYSLGEKSRLAVCRTVVFLDAYGRVPGPPVREWRPRHHVDQVYPARRLNRDGDYEVLLEFAGRHVLVTFPVSRGSISRQEVWDGLDRVMAKHLTHDN
jgi:hypothetical protein